MIKYCVFIFTSLFLVLNAQTISIYDEISEDYQSALSLFKSHNYEGALDMARLGFEKAQKLKDKNQIAYGYFYQARYYDKLGPYNESVILYMQALAIFKALDNTAQVSRCYYKLGFNHFKLADYDLGLDYYFKSLKLDEERNYKPGIALTLERIGKLYLNTGDFYKARESFERALNIFIELKDDYRMLMNESCIAVTYQKEAMRYDNDSLFYKAIDLYKVLLPKSSKKSPETHATLLQNIGSSYRFLKQYDKSLEYLIKSLPIQVELGLHKDSAHTCNDIAETYLDMNQLSKAKKYALKAVNFARGYALQQERYAYYVLYLIEEKTQNFESSLVNYKKYQKLQDSIFSLEKTNKINDLRIKYESDKQRLKIENQESNIALLDAKNSVKNQWLIFGSLGLLSVFLLFTISKSKNNAKKEKKQQEKFSQNLMESQEMERTRIAKELHDSVGQKLTLIKRKSQNTKQIELTNLTNDALEEVRSISRGLYPALLKELGLSRSLTQLVNEYDEQTELFYTMDIDIIDSYFTETASLNFYRLIQECLTNIVKHAKAKSVTVSIKKEKNSVIAFIADNGKGFDLEDSKKQNSLGLKTIFERIKILEGKLSIDSKLNTGTNFILTIPVKNES
ncbi:sensor histidine kinase [Algibacter sp.]|nr:sensor histidine kinase [Algibacter sp.]